MEEDIGHIDLIDKYLSGNLKGSEAIIFRELFEKNADFKKEVEIYERVYKKIDARGEANLKKRLDVYYKDYLEEKSNKPKGIYRKLIIISSIAAALIFGVIIFNNNDVTNQAPIFNEQAPTVVDIEIKDSVELDKTIDDKYIKHKEVIVQEDNAGDDSLFIPSKTKYNTQLSIGGLQKLPANSIRTISYPIVMKYTFDGSEIVLFGNPSISGLKLQLFKDNSASYYLKYKEQYYSITKSNSKKVLKESSNRVVEGAPTQEKVAIKLMNVNEIAVTSKNTEVSFTGNNVSNPTYFFQEKGKGIHIVINGDLNINHTKLYRVVEGNESNYFLKVDKKLYQLNSKVKEQTSLKEIYILTNKLTQLFREGGELPEETVYLIE